MWEFQLSRYRNPCETGSYKRQWNLEENTRLISFGGTTLPLKNVHIFV